MDEGKLLEFRDTKIALLPRSPGVYLFRDGEGTVLYVGKAADLRQRVRSYFQDPASLQPRTRVMMEKSEDFSYILTDSEEEAFILESNLIKEHSPRYNVRLKDDKHYPYLRLTMEEAYPRLVVTRRFENQTSRYFGPYGSVGAMRETIRIIKNIFPLRSCKQPLQEGEKKGRPCLNFQIKRCLAPCTGELSAAEYLAVAEQAALFLEGRQQALLKKIEREMLNASQALDFEKASRMRDQFFSLQKVMERQKAVANDTQDRDVITLASGAGASGVGAGIFKVRGGKLLSVENFTLKETENLDLEVVMKEFIRRFYSEASFIPGEFLLSHMPAEREFLETWLSKKRGGGRILFKVPRRGEKKALLDLLHKNLLQHREDEKRQKDEKTSALEELAKILHLPAPPERIEGYDVSHFAGEETVGSMVVFRDGQPQKEAYRRYKIKESRAADDYGALTEMLGRRLRNNRLPLPDLMLIDGGAGQLAVGEKVRREMGLSALPLASLAKEEEMIFIPGERAPLRLPASHPALKLLQRVRDEAHRFALALGRKRFSHKSLASFLENIKGVGPVRRQALLKHFGGLEAMKKASVEEISAVPGVSPALAENIFKAINNAQLTMHN